MFPAAATLSQDFNLEKQMMVHNAKMKIQEEYKKKEKNVDVQKRIKRSNELGQSKVRKMKSREQMLDGIKDDAIAELARYSAKDAGAYAALLKGLIVQGLIKLNEDEVYVRCRAADVEAVRGAAAAAEGEYKALIAAECNGEAVSCVVKLDTEQHLPPAPSAGSPEAHACSGGVLLLARGGRLRCDNTLDARLGLCFTDLKPVVGKMLFPKK